MTFPTYLHRPALLLLLASTLAGCTAADSSDLAQPTSDAPGELTIVANGEDFVRQGFTSKDGWRIDFDRVEVSLGETTIKQDNNATKTIAPMSIDLAAGDENAEPIALKTLTVPSGHYNGVDWSIEPDGDAPSLQLVGTAKKDGQTLTFDLAFAPNVAYACGEYVGDERKGFVEPDAPGELELTLHFDHIFGDAGAAPDEKINAKGFGFDRFAALAEGNKVVVTPESLDEQFSVEDIAALAGPISSLGHVGEGHCEAAGK